jgi:holo-[acyl-carrier protein] synthase
MIFGVGTDIVAIARLGALYSKHGERALEKMLAPSERDVVHDTLGRPGFQFAPELAALLDARQLTAHLSLSDEIDMAIAFVVLERL